jgi:hypothetical protein
MNKLIPWITAVPIVHLGLCYFYLYVYLTAFGDRLSQFSSIRDVYTVGLGKILPFYLTFGITALLVHLWNDKEPLKIVGRTEFERHPSLNNKYLDWMYLSLPFFALLGLFIQYFRDGKIFIHSFGFLIIMIFAYLQVRVFRENNFSELYRWPILAAFLGILQLGLGAYSDGFKDRHEEYKYFNQDIVICPDKTKLLSSIGDNFLAVSKTGKRYIVDSRCTKLFEFTKRRIMVDIF